MNKQDIQLLTKTGIDIGYLQAIYDIFELIIKHKNIDILSLKELIDKRKEK